MNTTKTFALVVAFAALAQVSSAVSIFDQIGTGSTVGTTGYATGNITDFAPNYNIMAIEDMTTTSAWHLDSIDMVFVFFNASAPDPANITGYQFAVYSSATGNGGTNGTANTGDVLNATFTTAAATITPNFNSVTGNYLVHLDLSSANLNLGPGSYWFGLAPDMPFGNGMGQIGVLNNTTSAANSGALNARQMNGGGGFALAGNNAAIAGGANLSYRLNASPVPEPATMAVLGLGAAALLRRRKKA